MDRLGLAIGLALAPFLAVAYYYAATLLMSHTDAGRFLAKGGSINTDKLDTYHLLVGLATVVGIGCAFFLGSQIDRRLKKSGASAE